MADVTATYRNGSTAQLANIYLRGTQIKFMILPEMLKNAPMLKVIYFNVKFRFDWKCLGCHQGVCSAKQLLEDWSRRWSWTRWRPRRWHGRPTWLEVNQHVLKSWNLFWFRLNKKTAPIKERLGLNGKKPSNRSLFGFFYHRKNKSYYHTCDRPYFGSVFSKLIKIQVFIKT